MPPFHDAKAIFFDVDNTLYDFEMSMRHAFVFLRERFPDVLGPHAIERVERAYFQFYEGLTHEAKLEMLLRDPDLYRRTMWAGALASLGVDDDPAANAWLAKAHPDVVLPLSHADGFVRVLTSDFQRMRPTHWRQAMYDGVDATLADLKARGTTLGAITNGPAVVQRPKLEALRYRTYFDEHLVFVSGEFGEWKPHRSIFEAAARAADVAPEECIMVGDAREFDMPAKALGFRTILFDGKQQKPDCANDPHPPDAIVQTYGELRKLLGLS